jgi:hypothetical protein
MTWQAWAVGGCLAALAGCGAEPGGGPGALPVGSLEQPFINGDDDRLEYFELEDQSTRILMSQSVVALVPDVLARALTRGNVEALSTWGENHSLCEGEPFEDQPAAAFCSGVLVDWDLVLTSGHCVNVFPLTRIRAVFGFYFQQPGELALSNDDVYEVAEVLVARDVVTPQNERLDYAWLRLEEPVGSPLAPVAIRTSGLDVELGDAIVAINAGGGVPFKHDAGGRIQDVRSNENDYFVADTDTSEGSSGGPAFDSELRLVGTLARGAPDYVETDDGCNRTARAEDPRLASEQFTYAARSVEGLCEVDPERWLCDEQARLPPPPTSSAFNDGCALSRAGNARFARTRPWLMGASLIALALTLGSRRRSRARA